MVIIGIIFCCVLALAICEQRSRVDCGWNVKGKYKG